MHRLVKFVFFRMEAEGISRKQFSLAAGVKERTLSNYASGYREPKMDILERMLHILGYDLCALQEGTGVRNDITGAGTSQNKASDTIP